MRLKVKLINNTIFLFLFSVLWLNPFLLKPVFAATTVLFSSASYSAAENAGTVTIEVYRNGDTSGASTVKYVTSNGTALAGTDYTATNGTLSFAGGDNLKTFNVPIIDDNVYEPTKTVKLTLGNPTGTTLGTLRTAVLNITNDDLPNGKFEFSASTYTVEENAGSVTIAVYRNNGSNGAVTVNYATSNGTALAGSDYTAASGTLSFADGETLKNFDVPIIDNNIYEPTKSVKLTLSSPTGGATLGSRKIAYLGIINDDLPNGKFAFSAATYTVVENAGNATITVCRNDGSSGAASVNYATSNGTALAGSDYTATNGTLSFADGETSKTFDVPIINDAVHEPAKTVKLTLSNPTGGTTLGSQKIAYLRIDDDDPSNGAFAFSAFTYTVVENAGNATITVCRNDGSSGAASVNYATSNGTALAGSDYTATNGTLSFADGETSKTFDVPIINDAVHELTETVKLTLSIPTGGATLDTQKIAYLRIDDDDPSNGVFGFSATTYTVAENAGTATITVNRNDGSYGAVTVNYATSNGTARAGSDYTATNGTLSFADGETSKTFDVPIINDAVHELTETVKLTLSIPTGGATLGTQKIAYLRITDDD